MEFKLGQLRKICYVNRIPDERLTMKVFYRELQAGKCSQCKLQNTLKACLNDFDIPMILGTGYKESIKDALSHQQRGSF